ncbi:MAG TPA: hypothetical protein VK517_00125 [Cyclobacteriaceae bacterium]|nr:hypothetical protein [Cyclobacteriaceae bacterium]
MVACVSCFPQVNAVSPYLLNPAKITPPSPNAAAFEKYGNIPVSAYTGVPNIAIPLYEIQIRDIKVPVSISYHASGIKVGEESSRVGLGWVLNSGGLISRNIIGADDFMEDPSAYLSTSTRPSIPPDPSTVPASNVQMGVVYQYKNVMGQTGSVDLANYISTGVADFEPDQYNYNFLGYSGRFTLSRQREAIVSKKEKIRIEVVGAIANSWKVTTHDGFVYLFADSEYFIDNGNGGGAQQKSAWYLTEIISPQQEHVYFYYTTQATQFVHPTGSFYEMTSTNVEWCGVNPCRTQPVVRKQVDRKFYSTIYLDRIEWELGKIKFNMATDRQDVEGDSRLTSIEIFNAKTATQPYEEIVFSQDYFVSSSAGPVSPSEFPVDVPDKALKRLKLASVTRRAVPVLPAQQPEQYSFVYYEGGNDQLPPKNSFARDHWGYYNVRLGNYSLIPSFTIPVSATPTLASLIGASGQQRDPSSQFMQANSLKSITYPSKGSTNFYYSTNDFSITTPVTNPDSPPEPYATTDSYIFDAAHNPTSLPLVLTNEYIDQQGHTLPIVIKAGFRIQMACGASLSNASGVYFELTPEAGGPPILTVSLGGNRCSEGVTDDFDCLFCDANSYTYTGFSVFTTTKQAIMPPGRYTWKASVPIGVAYVLDISTQITWWVDPIKQPKNPVTKAMVIKPFGNTNIQLTMIRLMPELKLAGWPMLIISIPFQCR